MPLRVGDPTNERLGWVDGSRRRVKDWATTMGSSTVDVSVTGRCLVCFPACYCRATTSRSRDRRPTPRCSGRRRIRGDGYIECASWSPVPPSLQNNDSVPVCLSWVVAGVMATLTDEVASVGCSSLEEYRTCLARKTGGPESNTACQVSLTPRQC